MKRTHSLFLLVVALLCLAGCKGRSGGSTKSETHPTPTGTTVLRVVHDPTMRGIMSFIAARIREYRPTLSNGSALDLQLIEELGVQAADEISSGKLKVDAWISPSQSLTDYARRRVRNLGARPADCREIAASPVIVAAHPNAIEALQAVPPHVDLAELYERDPLQTPLLIINHANPARSETGMAALIEMAYAARRETGKALTAETLRDSVVLEKLRRFETFAAQSGMTSQELLAKSVHSPADPLTLTITTEQQLVSFNREQPEAGHLKALYPTQGSYWLNYELCRSAADWVTTEQIAAFKVFAAYLGSSEVANELLRQGFRPISGGTGATAEQGLAPELPRRLLVPLAGEAVSELLKIRDEIRPPSATVALIDTSSSMQGESIRVVQERCSTMVRDMGPHDRMALVGFSGTALPLIGLTGDKTALLQKLDELEPAGGSALYDAISIGTRLFSDAELSGYRRQLLIVVDGRDNSSSNTAAMAGALLERVSRMQRMHLVVLGITGEDFNAAELKELAAAANGDYLETPRTEVFTAFEQALGLLE